MILNESNKIVSGEYIKTRLWMLVNDCDNTQTVINKKGTRHSNCFKAGIYFTGAKSKKSTHYSKRKIGFVIEIPESTMDAILLRCIL